MSQELAQDEAEADAEDYEIDALEGGGHRALPQHAEDDSDDDEGHRGKPAGGPGSHRIGDDNVVFAMGDDSDDDEDDEGHGDRARAGPAAGDRPPEYRDDDHDGNTGSKKTAKAD